MFNEEDSKKLNGEHLLEAIQILRCEVEGNTTWAYQVLDHFKIELREHIHSSQ